MDEEVQKSELIQQLNLLRAYKKLNRMKISETVNELISYCDQEKDNDPLLLPLHERPLRPERQTCRIRLLFEGCCM